MKSSKLKKLCAVVLAATVATSLFIGCGDSSLRVEVVLLINN